MIQWDELHKVTLLVTNCVERVNQLTNWLNRIQEGLF